ncbi:MAG: LPS-assembly protein LptD [Candidatus Cloacimonetes bacterium]|nr:LPS-assembly protein LptD [Candidatus Cloacimonadota bacterium]
MKKVLLLVIICLIGVIPVLPEPLPIKQIETIIPSEDTLQVINIEQQNIQTDSLFYAADSISYSEPKEQIDLMGSATINYQNSRIEADTISINLDQQQAFTRGKSYLKDGNQFLFGREIYYDLDTEWGLINQGASKFDKGYYYGREIRKVDKKIFDVDDAIFTTCSSESPHFYIKSSQLRLYQSDKIVARPLLFYVNHFPVFAFPFGTFSVVRGRKSGILIPSPGYNKTDGKLIENIAYYYAFKDYADATLYLNYYEKTGWKTGFTANYIKRYLYSGKFLTSLQKRVTGPDKYNYEWQIKATHHSDLGYDSTFDLDLDFVSSRRVWEGSVDIDERLSEKITSRMAYKRPLWGSALRISGTYVDDFKNEKKNITLPLITYSLPSKPVYELFFKDDLDGNPWWSNFSYSYNLRAVQVGDINDPDPSLAEIFYQTKKDTTDAYEIQHNAAIKHNFGLTYSYIMKGWLNLSETLSGNEIWYDRDKENNKLVRGYDYNSYSKISFSLYGLREFPGFYLNSVRHIFSPQVSYSHRPDFTRNDKYYSFGGIYLNQGEKQRRIALSLENKWQLKIVSGENSFRKINDFFRINSSIGYDLESEGRGFSNISHNLYLKPGQLNLGIAELSFTPSGKITQDTYDLEVKSFTPRDWDLGISNWDADLKTSLTFSGDAVYYDYFPVKENELVHSRFFNPDSLAENDSEDTISSLEELERLEIDKKNWSLTLSHYWGTSKSRYENHDYTNDLRISLAARLTKNWQISYKNYIDLEEMEPVSHYLVITRELHCWKLVFKYTKERNYWSYNFELFNLELPNDLKFSTSGNKK